MAMSCYHGQAAYIRIIASSAYNRLTLWSHPSPPPPPHHRFFCTQLEELFDKALRDTHQLRYIIAFPMVCTEFLRSTSPFAPEEVGVASSGALSHEMTQPNLMHAQLCVLSNLMFTAPSLLPFPCPPFLLPFPPPLPSSPSLLPFPPPLPSSPFPPPPSLLPLPSSPSLLFPPPLCVIQSYVYCSFPPPLPSSPSLLPLPSLTCKRRRDVRQYCQLLLGAHSLQGEQVSDGNAV